MTKLTYQYFDAGRGFLTDPNAFDGLPESDWRKSLPRYNASNIDANKKNSATFFELAAKKGCTPGQLALAWVLSRGDDVVPIPGTKSVKRIEENAKSCTLLPLSAAEIADIEASISEVVGDRYPPEMQHRNFNSRV